jgi:hypothetical protein
MRRVVTATLTALILVLAAAGGASASGGRASFDPFRPAAPRPEAPAAALNPFRVADAQPAAPAPAVPAKPAAATAPAAPAKACQSDDDCPGENFCAERGVCQAIQTRTNVLYLYYREGSFREILGLYWSKRGPSGYSVVAPVFWHYWTPKTQTRIVAPFFWRYRNYATNYTATVIVPGLPVSWTSQPDAHSFAIWPLFYRSTKFGWAAPLLLSFELANPDRKTSFGTVLLLYWWTHSSRRQLDIGIPFLFSWRTPANAFTFALPLNFYWRNGNDKNLLALPILYWNQNRSGASFYAITGYHTHHGPQSAGSLFWLYWFGADQRAGSAYDILFPLFYWARAEHGKKSLWLSPIGGYRRNDVEGSHTLALLPLLLYLRKDPAGSTSVVFPVFWHFRDSATGAAATAIPPFFARRSGPDETSTFAGVFPVGIYARSFTGSDGGGAGWGGGLFPLAFFGRRGDRSHAIVFPLFWRFTGTNRSTTVAAPIFYHHADRHGTATGILPLLTFFGQNDDDRYAIQFPFFWRFSNAQQGWSTTATPLGYHHTDRDGWSAGLPPLFFVGGGADHAYLAIVPLFWHFRDDKQQKSTTVVLTYLHRTQGDETTDALFPLLYYRRGARPGGSDETSFTFFPLFHYRRDASSTVVATPLGVSWKSGDGRRAVGFIGPYVWYRGANFTASGIPLLHVDVTNHATGERTRQFGPWFAIDAPGRRSRVLVPLYGRYDDAQEHDTYVFPTYFRQRRADGYSVDTLLPFYWHSQLGARTTTVIGPWYRHRDGAVHDTGVAPFYFYAKNNERSFLVVPPALLYRHADFKTHNVWLTAALVYHAHGPDSHTTVVFPLWWSGHDKERSHRILFPVYWHFANQEQKSDVNFVGPIYWATHDTTTTRGVLPIAWHSSDSASSAASNALLPLFYESHGPKRFRLFTAIAGYSKTESSHAWYVLPVASGDSPEGRFHMFFPLWFSRENKVTETKTRVVAPLLFVSRTTPQTSLTTALALFWRYRDIASSITLALPLYYDFHDLHESRTTLLLPFFVRHRREADDTTLLIAPLFYRRTSASDSTTVGFPLVWDFKTGSNRTTLVFPVYAHWKRPKYAATYIFPTYYYREGLGPNGPDGTYRRVIVPFFESAVKRHGDYMWEVLGGLFGHENVGRHRYLKVFFKTFESEAPAQAQTSWYGRPNRASRREATRGLNANIW